MPTQHPRKTWYERQAAVYKADRTKQDILTKARHSKQTPLPRVR